MPSLTDRINLQLAGLVAERQRILDQASKDVADVDTKIEALQSAKGILTPDVESTYAQLRAMGLVKEI